MRYSFPLLVLTGCGSILYGSPDGEDSDVTADNDVAVPVDTHGETNDDAVSPEGAEDGRAENAEDSHRPDDAQPDEAVEDEDGPADDSPDAEHAVEASDSTDIPYGDTGPVCNPEWCYATCLASGFARGECLPGWACNCTSGTICRGPFRGSAPFGRYVSYNIGVESGAVCRISTCAEFTGDTYLLIASAWNGENDNSCGLGSEIVAGPMVSGSVLTIYVSCLSPECSWSITVDCTPDCTAY